MCSHPGDVEKTFLRFEVVDFRDPDLVLCESILGGKDRPPKWNAGSQGSLIMRPIRYC